MAGIEPETPGYGRIALHPRPIEGLSFVSAWQETPHGRVECGWRAEKGEREVCCAVPAGAEASLVLEGASLDQIDPDGARAEQTEEGVRFLLGSGRYSFRWQA